MVESLSFSDNAAAKVWELIQEEGNFNLKLRVYVTGGGCSGFQYGFTFDEEVQPDDTVVMKKIRFFQAKDEAELAEEDEEEGGSGTEAETNVQLLVDPLSLQYLSGAEIDYQEDIEGEQFIIRNPNAKTTCGCGSSFTTE